MREIKFRGQRIDNNEWVYGYTYIGIPETYISYIIPEFLYNGYEHKQNGEFALRFEKYYEIYPETISQHTGLKDGAGKEIYEGDMIFNDDRDEKGIVKYDEQKAMFIVEYIETKDQFPLYHSHGNLYYSIGNIYEHQEVLKA